MKIAVFGIGYVGLVAAGCLAEGGNTVICVDNDKKKVANLKKGTIPIYEPGLTEIVKRNESLKRLIFTTEAASAVNECEILILAVGTPSAPDGSANISAILEVSAQIAKCMTEYKVIMTKSTVPVGTCKKVTDLIKSITDVPFDYVSNPEFLKEGSAVDDFLKPDRVIIGTDSKKAKEIMAQLYSPFMMKTSRIHFMNPISAEMTKYAANTMLATRISFMNELSQLCDTFGADIGMVRKGIGSDSRIGSAFLFPGIGYGGSCFPKDVSALIYMGDKQNCPMTIAQTVKNVNEKQKQLFAQRVIDYYKDKSDITLAVWGLAFKARTDDIRESPAIYCIEKFLENGIKVKAYDPEAMETTKQALGKKIETTKLRDDCLKGSAGLVIFTDWQEFRSPDFDLIKDELTSPVIFDGRNLYDPKMVKAKGLEYYSIGRP